MVALVMGQRCDKCQWCDMAAGTIYTGVRVVEYESGGV